jgi:amino acid transporter
VKDPGRTIPRALILSIVAVGAIYIVMNISVLGVVPWREMLTHGGDQNNYIISVFMERIYGSWAGRVIAALIIWTAFASVFSLLLGYSRVPYAAALDGSYFRVFARVHPEKRFPTVSLLALGAVAILFCLLRLADVIAALVVIRILLQFIVQAVGVIVLRYRQPDLPRPFRMWLYPLPALMAIAGFVYILLARKNFLREIKYAIVIVIVGLAIYLIRARKNKEWPFLDSVASVTNAA